MDGVNWSELTWEVLATPAWMGAVVALLMMFGKLLIDIIMRFVPATIPGGAEQKDAIRAALIMACSLGLSYALSAWRIGTGGPAFALAIAAFAIGMSTYEILSNVVQAIGVRLPKGWFGAPRGPS